MSAVGDIVSAYSNDVAADGTLDIKPAGTEEWVIHNIYCGDDAEIYWEDGTNTVKVHSITGAGWITGIFVHVNATYYMSIKNVSGGAADLGYDGVITRL